MRWFVPRIAYLVLALAAASSAADVWQSNGSAEMAVNAAIDTVIRNRGGFCGTPDVEAGMSLRKIGKPVVPVLISRLRLNTQGDVDSFIANTLSAICCDNFDASLHWDLVTRAESWWAVHRWQSEETWILNGIASGDSRRISRARERSDKVTSRAGQWRLKRLMNSENEGIAVTSAGILWKNFHSSSVLDHVRLVYSRGSKREKMEALDLCGWLELKELSPFIAQVLQTETDYQVTSRALDAAREMGGPDCVEAIEKMDVSGSPNIVQVIEALAALKGQAYGARVLQHLKSEDHGERMAAAQAAGKCVAPSEAITPLLKALDDPDLNVRNKACNSLGQAAGNAGAAPRLAEVIPKLIAQIEGPSSHEANRVLWFVIRDHFGEHAIPEGVDSTGLGGYQLSERVQPIWEEWWKEKGKALVAGGITSRGRGYEN